MDAVWICELCGNEYAGNQHAPPEICLICADDRQFIPASGPRWTRLDDTDAAHSLSVTESESGLFDLTLSPTVGIGQKTFLVETPEGNVLWEPPGFVGPALVDWLASRGGVHAIAASHPHLVGASVSLSHRFGRVPVWFNETDRRWITRPDPVITYWSGVADVLADVRLVQCGGHFPGSAVLHLPGAADGRGALLTGDTIMAVPHPQMVSFMRSYPNLIPLPPRLVRRIVDRVTALRFDRIYAAFGNPIITGATEIVERSAQRYIGWVTDALVDPDDDQS